QQLPAQAIADLPEPLEERDEAPVVLHAAAGSPGPARGARERADRSLAMAAQRAAVLVQDPALRPTVGGGISRPDSLRVLRARWLGHRASFRVSCSVTPVVRHRLPCR